MSDQGQRNNPTVDPELLASGIDGAQPSPLSTIEYYDKVVARVPEAREAMRLFLAPGVLHCAGGPGPDRFDALTALEAWVERGVPPETLVATKADASMSRPLCAYPALPRYRGVGDPNDAASFVCEAR